MGLGTGMEQWTLHELAAALALHAIVGKIDERQKVIALKANGGDPDKAVKDLYRHAAIAACGFADALVEQMKEPKP